VLYYLRIIIAAKGYIPFLYLKKTQEIPFYGKRRKAANNNGKAC
jgi:hypothetical protein